MARFKAHFVVPVLLMMLLTFEAKTGIAKDPSSATRNIKKYKLCYNSVHVCPELCPDSCTVECASCKPICSAGSTLLSNDGSHDHSPPNEGDHSPPDGSHDHSPPEGGYDHSPPNGDHHSPPVSPTPATPTTPEPFTPPPSTPTPPTPTPTPSTPTPTPPTMPTPSTPSPIPPTPTPSMPSPKPPTPTPPTTTPTPSPTPPTPSWPTLQHHHHPLLQHPLLRLCLHHHRPLILQHHPLSQQHHILLPLQLLQIQKLQQEQLDAETTTIPSVTTWSMSAPNLAPVDVRLIVSLASLFAVRCDRPGAVCQDPRFIGGDGITFYFHGKKDKDFCLVSDSSLHINAHFIGRRNHNMKRDFTWVQSIAIFFDNHQLFIGALKTSTWDNSVDRLALSFDGEPITLPETDGSKWQSTNVSITRVGETNSVSVEVQGKFKITGNVVPITEQDSRVHNYGIAKENCFAHLDLGFKADYVTHVNMGASMPVMGGDRDFQTSGLFAADCAVSRFTRGFDVEESASVLNLPSLRCASGINGKGVVCKR
ncbi:hypothetical protein EZV62_011233 [Acer yangbiense]|uniref:Root cap n=1 Tax=Acer yangbiense TaxID=1000413 RepID=A0A5C7I5V9_9ROSI|nr:hypothetical protein EZV62_011233 [Acer yangbiense]